MILFCNEARAASPKATCTSLVHTSAIRVDLLRVYGLGFRVESVGFRV